MNDTKWLSRFIILVSVSVLASCIAGCNPSQVVGQGGTLQGTCWELTQINGTPVPPPWRGVKITLGFDNNGNLYGHTTYNDYWGPYTTTGAQMTLVTAAFTLIEDSPEGQTYSKVLPTVYSYTASNGQLTLYDSSGATILEYIAAHPSACPPQGHVPSVPY